ncbi:MAG TPA: sugar transferase [Bacillus sp. (in: Bacteria)]|uniref:Sugar transferase n=2 Tax=Bacillus cereus group TaxID=86661 RepID=A0A9X7BD36_BACCE|nr:MULTISPECIES: sugar transferase [Bacillus]ANN31772.1 capsular biosynthesis protein [Bacillus thuringiensis serovar coreanensis]MCU7388920.1 sugar transferase [Bacillus sp. ST24]HCF51602.1 sugar transferase [Bacillus sp. (in: firmicutes)]AHX17771.1 capsular biosynthesis protein [Bacillus bombysepticus str. Wang]AKR34548.1 UDP-N-acetylgalactosamine-undecaprenyl-phosphate N-acetylgalactosaminephosphotransferase [Bacillus thuringiensis serovar indiana]
MIRETNQAKLYTIPAQEKPSILNRSVKRLFDIIFSIILLLLTIPIMLFFCIMITLETSGAPIYFQERLGINGKKFNVFKLRSMVKDAEINGPQWAKEHDPRITKVGLFIRKTRIDELPQLLNILRGDMSFVGPRPEREFFYNEFDAYIPEFKERLMVKPGLTGWAQINGGYNLDPKEKLRLDMEYIEMKTIRMDIRILCKTVLIVLNGNGAR